jgi:hypothetical protein
MGQSTYDVAISQRSIGDTMFGYGILGTLLVICLDRLARSESMSTNRGG